MKIYLQKIKISDLIKNYSNLEEEGVTAFGGKLNVRPKYQREFIYKLDKQKAVINSISKNYPLNTMYWVKNENDTFELLDGQQRTMSICEYIRGAFSFNNRFWDNLTNDQQSNILNYELHIYVCEGTDSERLEWFKTINISGEKLTDQELRNANFTGEWLTSAKNYFSRTGNKNKALNRFGDYMSGTPNRQDILEKVLSWIVDYQKINNDDPITQYMAIHQHDENADDLWNYFLNVIGWVKTNFTDYYKEMKNVNWGYLYNKYSQQKIDIIKINNLISELMKSDDIDSKKGIFEYVLDGDEKHLNLRLFSNKDKRTMYERQKHICPDCKKEFPIEKMEAHHIKRFSDGGPRDISNGVMLCRECHDKRHRLDSYRYKNMKKLAKQ